MAEENEERRGFHVKDRRRFDESGEARPEAPEEKPTSAGPPSGAAAGESAPPRAERAEEPVSFSTFLLGLSTQALLHLGEIPNPITETVERDLGAAKHVIDILGILQDKTRNNLDPSESEILESMLYDLRMRFVSLARGTAEKEKEKA